MIRVLLLLALAGCSPAALLNATVASGDTTVERGVRYMPGPRGLLDVYRPAHPAGPLVVFLYGGSWSMGDRAMYAFLGRPLARRGAVVVVPDYRLVPDVHFPEFLQDNARAVAWAMRHAASLGADPNRVFVMGHSAGAYDAAMLALDPDYLAAAGEARGRLAGAIGLAGPYDFMPSDDAGAIAAFGAANRPENDAVAHVDGAAPPMLLLHGAADTTVRPRNTDSLAARIRAKGGTVQVRTYPGVAHIGLVTAIAPLFQGRAPVLDDVAAFLGLPAS